MHIHMQIKVMVGEDRFLYKPQNSGLLSKGRSFNLTQIILGVTEILKRQEKSVSENSARLDIP